MPTATAREKIPTVPPPAPPPEEHVPDLRGQGVHAKALRIRAFWSEIGRTPGCPACETPVRGSHTLVNAKRIKMPGTRAAEQHQRRRRYVELLEIRIHDRWTRVRVEQIPTRRDQEQLLRQRELGEPDECGGQDEDGDLRKRRCLAKSSVTQTFLEHLFQTC